MKLSKLLINCDRTVPVSPGSKPVFDPEIRHIASDSRQIQPGGLFIAARGVVGDGHDFMEQAFENGAAAVVAQHNPKNLDNVILLKDSYLAVPAIAAEFYGHPSQDLSLVGITGTNGKTTVSWLLESILTACGYITGVIGTVNIRYKDIEIDNPFTTPDPVFLQKTLHQMKKAGVSHVIVEVSSHGLALNRMDYCRFDAGVFTNLSQDHLDFHETMDAYFESKKRLFTRFLGRASAKDAPAILNVDDPKGRLLFSSLQCRTIGVSAREPGSKDALIHASQVSDEISGLSGNLNIEDDKISFASPLTGPFNLENILCAAGTAHALGVAPDNIRIGIEACHSVPGRLEKVSTSIDRHLFVDYAHTPDALDSVLSAIVPSAPKRVITVFGCGGDRDRKKRPLMGQAACRHSDIAIVTSDNPRSEPPDAIIEDILSGLDDATPLNETDLAQHPFKKGYLVEEDRKKAIAKAIDISKPGDIILVAGKGHETYQITNDGTIHFDDREELLAAAEKFSRQFDPIPWQIDDLVSALGCDPALPVSDSGTVFSGIGTDSRTIDPTQLFVALKGDNFDGHTFTVPLAQKGVKGFVVQKGFVAGLKEKEKSLFETGQIVLFETDDTLTALGKLARYHRLRANVKVLALTGSSGKTTTRKITSEIFNTRFHTHATSGNLNNEIGVPLTLLKLSAAHEWAVIEMGMNHAGEISRLTRIALPDIAMVINTAGVHLEGLGTVENVAKAKAEIFEGVNPDGTAVIFRDDKRNAILEEKARQNKKIGQILFFGSTDASDIRVSTIMPGGGTTDFKVEILGNPTPFSIPSPGRFMVNNSMAAIAAAVAAGIDTQCMQKGIGAFSPVSGRLNISRPMDCFNLIDDTYNANPASVYQALKTLKEVCPDGDSTAVLGDMLELGEATAQLHKEIGKKAAQLSIRRLFIFGPMGKHTIQGAIENGFAPENIFSGSKEDIARELAPVLRTESWVLVKGSRGMAMEVVIRELKTILPHHS